MTSAAWPQTLDSSPEAAPALRIVAARNGRSVTLRVAREADAGPIQQFVRGLSLRSRRNRYFSALRELPADQLDRIARSRGPAEFTLLGESASEAGPSIVAMAQFVACRPADAEFAVAVGDAWQRQGLGSALLGTLTEYAARAGYACMRGFVLPDNWAMLTLLSRLGCEFMTDSDPHVVCAIKRFDSHGWARPRPDDPRLPALPVEANAGYAEYFLS